MLLKTREFVEQSLRISSKSNYLKPQSLWRQPLFKGRHPICPSLGARRRTSALLLSGSSMIFNKLKFIELTSDYGDFPGHLDASFFSMTISSLFVFIRSCCASMC